MEINRPDLPGGDGGVEKPPDFGVVPAAGAVERRKVADSFEVGPREQPPEAGIAPVGGEETAEQKFGHALRGVGDLLEHLA